MDIPLVEWHTYSLVWQEGRVSFMVDGRYLYETGVSPIGPLGLVIWVDNQYAAFPPDGRVRFGTLENPAPAWIEITGIEVGPGLF